MQWTAEDLDTDQLVYSIWYSPDNGDTWLPIEVGRKDTKLPIDFDQLPGSNDNKGLLRVLASDGVLTAESRTESPLTVPHKPPKVDIAQLGTPGRSDTQLQAVASDLEDITISSPKNYQWTSDWDGGGGQGLFFNVWQLTPGNHVVTLTVTDSDGISSSTSTTVTSPSTPLEGGQVIGLLGGSLSFDPFLPMTLTVPIKAVLNETHFNFSLPENTYFDPPYTIGSSFVISATTSSGSPVTQFLLPLTLEISYSDQDVAGMDEHRL